MKRMYKSIVSQKSNKRKKTIYGAWLKVGGRPVARVCGDKLVKRIHNGLMLHTPPSIANDIQLLNDALLAGCVYCEVTNTDTDITYRARIDKILSVGFKFNRGWGWQIACELHHFTQTRGGDIIPLNTPDGVDPDGSHGAIVPLEYKSHVTVGAVRNGEQMPLFEDGK